MKVLKKFSILLALSFLLGCSSGNNNNLIEETNKTEETKNTEGKIEIKEKSQSVSNSEKTTSSSPTCNWNLWQEANSRCLGDSNCAARTYREMSGGDIKGGMDCVISTYKKKMESMGIDINKQFIELKNSDDIIWSAKLPDYFLKKAGEISNVEGQELVLIELGKKILEIGKTPIQKYSGHYYIGEAKRELKDYEGALEAYEKGLAMKPVGFNNCDMYLARAIAYWRMDELDLAIEDALISLERCFGDKKTNLQNYYMLSRIYEEKGDMDKMWFYIGEGLKLSPGNKTLIDYRKDKNLEAGNYEEYCKTMKYKAADWKQMIRDINWGYIKLKEGATVADLENSAEKQELNEAETICGDLY